jgi:fermentation-respiration switch protein FrsA (DUF1100 family)
MNRIRKFWPIAAILACILIFVMTTNFFEQMFVYFPTRGLEADPSAVGLDYLDIHPTTRDGVRLHGWFVPKAGARHTLLIFHGNAGNISHRVDWIRLLHSLDVHVMIVDYRGYGRSEGKPFEAGLYLDALAAYDWWARERAGDRSKLILLGESLGGAVAVDLASKVSVDGIVLQSTFSSAWDVARKMIPIGLLQPLTGIRFDSAAKMETIRCPKLFIHGNQDDIIPIALGRKLYNAAAPPKEFYEVPGANHNDLIWVAGPEYLTRLASFLK